MSARAGFAEHSTILLAFDIEEEFNRRKAQLEKLLGVPLDTPADPASVVGRILALLESGDAIELRNIPTPRADEFVGSFEFTDALFELLPALNAVQLGFIGHGIPPLLSFLTTTADHGLGSVLKAGPSREDGQP